MGENCCRNTAGQCNGAGEDMVCTKRIWYTFTGISVKFATTKGCSFWRSNFQNQPCNLRSFHFIQSTKSISCGY